MAKYASSVRSLSELLNTLNDMGNGGLIAVHFPDQAWESDGDYRPLEKVSFGKRGDDVIVIFHATRHPEEGITYKDLDD